MGGQIRSSLRSIGAAPVVSTVLIGVCVIFLAGCGGQTGSQEFAAQPTMTSAASTTTTTTTTVDLEAFRIPYRKSVRTLDTIRQDALLINQEWDSRAASYSATHSQLVALVSDVADFVELANLLPITPLQSDAWDRTKDLREIQAAAEDMLVGLEMSDDGSFRREALLRFDLIVDDYIGATGVGLPASRSTSTTPLRPPSVAISCPEPTTVNWGHGVMVTFGYSIREGSNETVEWTIDYGDGRSYTSTSWEDAERNLFWHKYTSPGSFIATVSVLDSSGHSDTDHCIVSFEWEDKPQVRIGAICRDGWRSSATGRGACSWHGGVDYWLYG